jgi:nitroreductase
MPGTFCETIRIRHSTRRYADRSVPDDVLAHLLEFAARASHLTDVPPRVTVVNGRERVGRILARYLGVYGLVQGAPHLLVGLIPEDSDRARLDLGYVLEQVVLEATRLGLSTCWMTGSYHPERAADEVERRPGEVVAATVALGYAREDPLARLHDGTVRRLVAAHRRRPLEEIVFAGKWGVPWSPVGADPALVEVLECARLAPSAENRQPWRFVVEDGAEGQFPSPASLFDRAGAHRRGHCDGPRGAGRSGGGVGRALGPALAGPDPGPGPGRSAGCRPGGDVLLFTTKTRRHEGKLIIKKLTIILLVSLCLRGYNIHHKARRHEGKLTIIFFVSLCLRGYDLPRRKRSSIRSARPTTSSRPNWGTSRS